jgi:hypothetical protein
MQYPVVARIADVYAVIPDKKPLRIAKIICSKRCAQDIGAYPVSVGRGDLLFPIIVKICIVGCL